MHYIAFQIQSEEHAMRILGFRMEAYQKTEMRLTVVQNQKIVADAICTLPRVDKRIVDGITCEVKFPINIDWRHFSCDPKIEAYLRSMSYINAFRLAGDSMRELIEEMGKYQDWNKIHMPQPVPYGKPIWVVDPDKYGHGNTGDRSWMLKHNLDFGIEYNSGNIIENVTS